jgi:cytoskeletal protein CcmA (bactofilin family)
MFKRRTESSTPQQVVITPTERVTSVLGPGITWKGDLTGSGGVRIEGAFEGTVAIQGLVVIGQSGRVNTSTLSANSVIVAGFVQGNIEAEKLEIRSTGHVWGDVKVVSFSTQEGAFLRGKVTMEESVDIAEAAGVDEIEMFEAIDPDVDPESES